MILDEIRNRMKENSSMVENESDAKRILRLLVEEVSLDGNRKRHLGWKFTNYFRISLRGQ